MKKFLPIVLLVIGLLFVLGAGLFAVFGGAPQAAPAQAGTDVPQTLVSFALTNSQTGATAAASIQQLHGGKVPLVSGIVAVYGENSARLWVAETASDAQALQYIQDMDSSISAGGSPFTPKGVFQFRNRDVYMVETSTTSEFFMQAGSKVIWVSTAPEQAEQAMKEMLDFYP